MKLRHLAIAPLAILVGCDDTPATTNDANTTADVTDDTSADAAADSNAASDINAPDTTPVESRPLAKVYRIDPGLTPDLTEVELEHLTSEDGTLVGEFARVRSCIPDLERGSKVPLDLGGFQLNLTTCYPTSQVTPGEDGTYLHVLPPETPADDDGKFAEVMMYHHIQVIHDYFKDVHGLTDRDEPLDALTNVQAHVDLCDQWAKIANAAFIPAGGLDSLGVELDLDLDGDAIVFSGTDTKNFSYDASVIYHEYTHAILGATRLNAAFLDTQGLNNLPGALNEAYADYFAGTLTEESATGSYALNDLTGMAICGFELGGGGNFARDMEVDKTCPNDLTAEVHADSEIFSSALWQIRKDLGKTDADAVILSAVLTLTNTSDFEIAATETIDAARELLGDEAKAKVEKAFSDRGILGCKRVLPIERVGERGLPVTLEAVDAMQPNPFRTFMPGYLQYSLNVPENTAKLVLTLELQAGGLMGTGGAEPELEVAFKPGTEPVSYTFGASSGRHDGAVVLPVVDGKVTFEGDPGQIITPGAWTFAIHNKGGASSLNSIKAAFTAIAR